MFYITQNSHYPWNPLPKVSNDWRALGAPTNGKDLVAEEVTDHQVRRQNYINSIQYELDTLVDFALRHADEDAIFVIVGDHQPPRVSRRSDGFETPIHIISRDPALITGLAEYGMTPHMVVEGPPTLHHQGLYSLLVRVLVEHYGETPQALPPYLPEGVVLEEWTVAEETE
jgi:hypothetical protein